MSIQRDYEPTCLFDSQIGNSLILLSQELLEGAFNLQIETKTLMKRLLHLLTLDELKQLYASLGGKESLEGLSRGFVIEKIQRKVQTPDLFQNEYTMSLLLGRINEAIGFIEASIDRLDRTDLIKIYQDFNPEKLKREDLKKSEIVQLILNQVPITELLKNKRLQERLKPKYISIADIRSLKTDIEALKTETDYISNAVKLLSERVWSVDNSLKEAYSKLRIVENMFEIGETPDLETFLKALYEESISIGEKPSPESFHGIVERLQKKLGINERTFILKGIELLLTHYMLSQVKDLPWQPALEDFMKVLREEFRGVAFGEKAEIPSLRDRVSRRLGISDEIFDSLLIKAWKEDLVFLEAGAPIGEFGVKHLETKEGQKFYYVSIR